MKNQKRATIVGETTGGGAHPVSGHTVADYFMVDVPFAKSLDPVTKTNWEGTGVEPDMKVPAADALATAEKLKKLRRALLGSSRRPGGYSPVLRADTGSQHPRRQPLEGEGRGILATKVRARKWEKKV